MIWKIMIPLALMTVWVEAQNGLEKSELILPIVANGIIDDPVHLQTTFSFFNLAASATEATLVVYDNSGAVDTGFLNCVPVPPPPQEVTLPFTPDGSVHFSGTTDEPVLTGWGKLTWEGPARISGSAEITVIKKDPIPCAVICSRPSGEIATTAQVPAVRPSKAFRAETIVTKNRESAFAVVNPHESETVKVTITLRDSSGEILVIGSNRIAQATYEIAPLQRLSDFVWELVFNFCKFMPICIGTPAGAPPKPEMFHGSLEITGDLPIAVGSLHVLFPEGKFVNNPVSRVEESMGP